MADCHNLFKEFNRVVKLGDSYKGELRTSRNDLRKKVRVKFREEGYEVKFHEQGSFAMGTIIQPKDGNYDIDDGIYILRNSEPETPISKLHSWVVEASEEHTSMKPSDRNPCVRVLFKEGHHVDLVIYYKTEYDHPKLAHKGDGWIVSDPKEFMDWFKDEARNKVQLRRLVRYFKAWADNVSGVMPRGLMFTILAVNNYHSDARDDVAFLETMRGIRGTLELNFICMRPTTPYEDLFAIYSETNKQYFLNRLDAFIISGNQAIEEPNQKEACKKWQRYFGDRFSCSNAQEQLDTAKVFNKAPFIRTDGASA